MKNYLTKIVIIFFIIFSSKELVNAEQWNDVFTFPLVNLTAQGMNGGGEKTVFFCSERQKLKGYDPMTKGLAFYKSTDKGITWDSIYSTERSVYENEYCTSLTGMKVIDDDTIIVAYTNKPYEGKIAKTYDGGLTWLELPFDSYVEDKDTRECGFIRFANSKKGVVFTRRDTLLTTINGGETWYHSGLPRTEDGSAMGVYYCRIQGDSIVLLTSYCQEYEKRQLLISTDWGKSWEAKKIEINSDFFEIRTFDMNKNQIWCAGRKVGEKKDTYILYSGNAGDSWNIIDRKSNMSTVRNIEHYNKDSLMLFSWYEVFRSTDNGKSWVEDSVKKYGMQTCFVEYFGLITWDNLLFIDGSRLLVYQSSDVNGIKSNQDEYVGRCYPNPVCKNTLLNVDIPRVLFNYEIILCDLNAQVVARQKNTNRIQVPNNIESGA
jgi:hypothetical protein